MCQSYPALYKGQPMKYNNDYENISSSTETGDNNKINVALHQSGMIYN